MGEISLHLHPVGKSGRCRQKDEGGEQLCAGSSGSCSSPVGRGMIRLEQGTPKLHMHTSPGTEWGEHTMNVSSFKYRTSCPGTAALPGLSWLCAASPRSWFGGIGELSHYYHFC